MENDEWSIHFTEFLIILSIFVKISKLNIQKKLWEWL